MTRNPRNVSMNDLLNISLIYRCAIAYNIWGRRNSVCTTIWELGGMDNGKSH